MSSLPQQAQPAVQGKVDFRENACIFPKRRMRSSPLILAARVPALFAIRSRKWQRRFKLVAAPDACMKHELVLRSQSTHAFSPARRGADDHAFRALPSGPREPLVPEPSGQGAALHSPYALLYLKSDHLWASFSPWLCFSPVNVALLRLPPFSLARTKNPSQIC